MAKIGSDGWHATEAVREAARLREPDRYLAALLAPRSVREDLVALAAFSAELLRVHDIVREAMMGEIRLQWWRDALQVLARGERTANPIADALGTAMLRHNVAPALLEIAIETRSRELQAVAEVGGVGTAVEAEAALFRAALLVLDVPVTPASDVACASAGMAYGIARGFVITSVRQGIRHVAPAQGVQAREALVTARGQITELGPKALVAFLPLVMVEPYLRALEQRDADRHGHFAYITPLRRVWRIWRAKRRQRV